MKKNFYIKSDTELLQNIINNQKYLSLKVQQTLPLNYYILSL